ncbi:MAG: PAS domain-containing protein, partial [Nitriliruptorales bacterium]|nr:PAS domain-containing protein [Nitriliruptorales bacterium]
MTEPRSSAPRAYVGLWAAIAIAAVVASLLISGWPEALDPVRTLGLLAAVSVAETIHLRFHWDRTTSDFTFTEVAIVATIILVPPSVGLLVIAAGIVVSQSVRRLAPIKIAFNVSQVTAASAAAMAVLAIAPDLGPSVAGHGVISVVAGMGAYVLLNLLALTGLLHRLANQRPRDVIREHGALSTLAVVGNTAIGILVAHVWVTQPTLLPVLAAPLAAMQLSYRGTVRSRGLLAQLRTEHERLDRVVLSTSDGILLLDGQATIELWNPALEQMTGIPAEEAVGRPVGEVLTRDLRQGGSPTTDRWRMASAKPGEPAATEETTLLRPDGTRRFVRESHTFLFDPRGRCIGDVVLV